MKKKKSKSKRFKKVNGQLVEFLPSFQECMNECRRVSPPHEDCETLCLPYLDSRRVRLDVECYERCRRWRSHGICDHICQVPY